jgi:hypothetical protein
MTALCWWVFWWSFLSGLYERPPSAQVFVLDDYRPVPPTDRRAA